MHCVDDLEVNLTDIALSSYVPKQIGQPSIKGKKSEFHVIFFFKINIARDEPY